MSRIVLRPLERFRHHPLQSPDRQIRLLSILPSPDGAIAQYSLQTHILNDSKCPYFHALSYEWGSDQPTSDIAINGNLFKIRPNLKDFLDLLRSGHEDYIRPFWIDAICIDQTNTAERNAQVKIMGHIFQSANLVMTWLGKQDFDDARLVDAITCLEQWKSKREYRRLVNPDNFHEVGPVTRARTPPLLGTAKEIIDMWACLRLLCEQSFWTRCWIVQEQVKAKKLLLLWGIQQIPWVTLTIAFRTIHAYVTGQPETMWQGSPWSPILSSIPYKVWLHVEGDIQDHPLLELMRTYRSSKCSVPHDKAYSLTGISSDSELLQVDYDKSLPDLYISLMHLTQDKKDCLKYSHLVLEALDLNPQVLSRDSTLRGHNIICDAQCEGQVLVTKRIRIRASNVSVMLETDILEMLIHSGIVILPEELERIAEYAKIAYNAFRRLRGVDTVLNFFFLTSGRLGVSLAEITMDDTIYSLPGVLEGPEQIQVRAESSQDPAADSDSVYTSPVSPSLSSPTSTSFSDFHMSPVARVWLMDTLPPGSPSKETPVTIPLAELVALDIFLSIEFENSPPSPTLPHRRTSKTPSVTTHHGAYTDSVGSAIDEAMRSPNVKLAKRASTWPIDKIAREMMDKLILDPTSPLNSLD